MGLTAQKRQKMEKLIYDTFQAYDPTGENVKKYKSKFKGMTDSEFDSFFKRLFASDEYLILDIVEYERDVKIENIEKAAKVLNIPLFEYVALPFFNKDLQKPVITKYKVPVGYLHLKRLQQTLQKKNTSSINIGGRASITGQVVGKDKNARDSDVENFSLVTLGADNILKEFMGARADDMVMKNEMYSKISQNGYISLDQLTNNVKNKSTINTVDAYFIGMGIKTDLVTKGLQTIGTLESKTQ